MRMAWRVRAADAVPEQVEHHMLALGHHHGRGPQDDPDVQDHRRFIGPGQRLVEAKARRDLDDEDDKQRQEQAAANGIGGVFAASGSWVPAFTWSR